ncbi:MAG: CoA-binding protein [Chloroflexota bacterium]|nr:MAG: CoA-binding protein [Chloroflexota bacterium]
MNSIVEQLDPIFKPKSIAVLGASDSVGKWGYLMVERPLKTGFGGAIYPVNPNKKEILGLRSYPSILDIPGQIDLAVMAVPAPSVPGLMQECSQKKVKGAVLIPGGFAEAGSEGKILENEVARIARAGKIRFVGPNCMGIWSATVNLNLCFYQAPKPGAIAFVSQSGTFGGYLSEIANAKGYGLSKFISIGNQADLTASEYLEYLAEDDETKAIVFYMEGFKDGKRFFQFAREVIKKKPIVIFKGGSTGAGARATLSHTASLAGSEHVFEGMCRQVGLIRVSEAIHAFEMAEALVEEQPLPRGRRIAIMGSGGQGVIATDACASLGLEVPEFDKATAMSLQEFLPPHAPPARNPIDFASGYRTAVDETRVIEKILSLDYIDGVITNAPVNPRSWGPKPTPADKDKSPPDTIEVATQAAHLFTTLPKKYHKPIIAVRFRRTDDRTTDILKEAGIPIYDTPEQCARAMYALVKYAEARRAAEQQ